MRPKSIDLPHYRRTEDPPPLSSIDTCILSNLHNGSSNNTSNNYKYKDVIDNNNFNVYYDYNANNMNVKSMLKDEDLEKALTKSIAIGNVSSNRHQGYQKNSQQKSFYDVCDDDNNTISSDDSMPVSATHYFRFSFSFPIITGSKREGLRHWGG